MASEIHSAPPAPAPRRVFVVEDEVMIRMLLEDMLAELGYEVTAAAGRVGEALHVAKEAVFDVAILDINLNGETVYPVADILAERGVPFVFSTGYGDSGLPEPYRARPILQKPFHIDRLDKTLSSLFGSDKI
jgi:CheY-like chemotaxis protein